MPTAELDKELEAAGYSDRTVKRARQRAGVKVRRVGFGAEGKWMVSLPDLDQDGEVDGGDQEAAEPPADLAP
jgi:hypothetical protein